MTTLCVAATQMACSWTLEDNLNRAETLVRRAASQGARIILLQELFETPYFCIQQDATHFDLAHDPASSPLIERFCALAAELRVVLPLSFFERAGNTRFNSVLVIDADGAVKSRYRKTHIPQNPGYEEKFYFSPGDTGFVVTDTAYARIGVGICWDQWFPEAARAMALKGAELLFYPTAIGSEPSDPAYDSRDHWQCVMQGHAGANLVPVVASNRIGTERMGDSEVTFYGSSFIADQFGAKLAEAGRGEETVLTAEIDLDAARLDREGWGVFRDRRPDCYGDLMKLA